MTSKKLMATMQVFIREHMVACASDLLTWHRTGVLPEGKLREAADIIRPAYGDDALNLAEGKVVLEALAVVAQPPEKDPRGDQ